MTRLDFVKHCYREEERTDEKCRIAGQFKVSDGLHQNHTRAILTCCVAFSSCMGYLVIHLDNQELIHS